MGFKLKPEATYPIQITHAYWFQILKRKEKRQKLSSVTNHLFCAPSFPLPALNKLLYTQHSFWLWYAPYPPSNIFLIRCLQALNLPNANTTEQKREERKRLYERRKKINKWSNTENVKLAYLHCSITSFWLDPISYIAVVCLELNPKYNRQKSVDYFKLFSFRQYLQQYLIITHLELSHITII